MVWSNLRWQNSGVDFTIMPAYCAECRSWAITGAWARVQQGYCPHPTVWCYAHRTQPVHPVHETSCCMPYCTTEPFVSGFLSAVAGSYLYDNSQKMDETGVEQLEARSQAKSHNLQDKYISEIQANWRVLIATHCKVWKLQRPTLSDWVRLSRPNVACAMPKIHSLGPIEQHAL